MNGLLIKFKWKWLPSIRKRFFKSSVSLGKGIFGLLPDICSLIIRNSISLVRKMDYDKAPIFLSIDSWTEYDKRTRSCSKEPETVSWIEGFVKESDVVFDIGANVGAYSLVIAKHTAGKAKVYAFEPSFSTFSQLCKNVFLNKCDGVVVPMYVALSDRTGIDFFNYSSLDTGTALHALGEAGDFKAVYKQPIICYTIDDFIAQFAIEQPNHIKLDVDGIEYTILKGAKNTLANSKLRSIIVEAEEKREGSEGIEDLLKESGFRLHSCHVHNQNPLHKGPYVRNCIFTRL